jgi:hypothetical protein
MLSYTIVAAITGGQSGGSLFSPWGGSPQGLITLARVEVPEIAQNAFNPFLTYLGLLVFNRDAYHDSAFDLLDRTVHPAADDLRARDLRLVVNYYDRIRSNLRPCLAQGFLELRDWDAGICRAGLHFAQAHMSTGRLRSQDLDLRRVRG